MEDSVVYPREADHVGVRQWFTILSLSIPSQGRAWRLVRQPKKGSERRKSPLRRGEGSHVCVRERMRPGTRGFSCRCNMRGRGPSPDRACLTCIQIGRYCSNPGTRGEVDCESASHKMQRKQAGMIPVRFCSKGYETAVAPGRLLLCTAGFIRPQVVPLSGFQLFTEPEPLKRSYRPYHYLSPVVSAAAVRLFFPIPPPPRTIDGRGKPCGGNERNTIQPPGNSNLIQSGENG